MYNALHIWVILELSLTRTVSTNGYFSYTPNQTSDRITENLRLKITLQVNKCAVLLYKQQQDMLSIDTNTSHPFL